MPRRGRGSVRNEREEPLRTFAWQMRTPARGQRSITPGAFRSQLGPDLRLRLTPAGAVGEHSRCCPSPVSEKLLPHSVAAHGLLMGFLSLKCVRSQTLPWNFEANRSALPPIYGERKVHREKGALCPSHMDRPRSRVAGTRLHAKIKMRSPRGFL